MEPSPPGSLLIVAHGVPGGDPRGEPANRHAARIRRTRGYAQVRTAFLRQRPALGDVLRALAETGTARLVVVPFFMAEGWYTGEVVGRAVAEWSLAAGRPPTGSLRTIGVSRAVGAHATMVGHVERHAIGMIHGARRDEVGLVLVGHGTPRSETSRRSVEDVARVLGERGTFAAVETAFLDERPSLDDALDAVEDGGIEHLVVVPYFAADGYHVREHVTAAARRRRRPTTVACASAVGTMPAMARVIAACAREAPVANGTYTERGRGWARSI